MKKKYQEVMNARAVELWQAKSEMAVCYPHGFDQRSIIEMLHYTSHECAIDETSKAMATTAANAERIWGTKVAKKMFDKAMGLASRKEYVVETHPAPDDFIPMAKSQA